MYPWAPAQQAMAARMVLVDKVINISLFMKGLHVHN